MLRISMWLFLGVLLALSSTVSVVRANEEANLEKTFKADYDAGMASDDFQRRESAVKGLRDKPFKIVGDLALYAVAQETLKNKTDHSVMREALSVIANLKNAEAVSTICKAIDKDTLKLGNFVRGRLLRAVGETKTDDAMNSILAAFKEKDQTMQLAAIDAAGFFGFKGRDKTKERVFAILKDSKTPRNVLICALGAIGQICKVENTKDTQDNDVVEFLIKMLADAEDSIGNDARKALMAITGTDQGEDAQPWSDWWYSGRFAAERAATGGGDSGKGAEVKGGGRTFTKKPNKRVYGQRIDKRSVFILDVSKSMLEPLQNIPDIKSRIEYERKRSQGPITGGEKGGASPKKEDEDKGDSKKKGRDQDKSPGGDNKKDLDWEKIKIKWDLASQELINTIESLDDSYSFALIFFSTQIEPWKDGKIEKATKEHRDAAVAAIRKYNPLGDTNTYGALMAGLNCVADKGVNERLKDPKNAGGNTTGRPEPKIEKEMIEKGAQAIYFITDGTPTNGEITDPMEIRARIAEFNATRKVKINTFYVGDPIRGQHHGYGLLQWLADDSGGVFVDLLKRDANEQRAAVGGEGK